MTEFRASVSRRLGHTDHAEDLASRLLQCFPKSRLSAQAALSHEYFGSLPPRLWELPDSQCLVEPMSPPSQSTNIDHRDTILFL